MMDPFQIKYGKVPTAALSLATLISEIMWVTGTLIGLGKNVSICNTSSVSDAFSPCVLIPAAEQLLIAALFWGVE